MFPLYTLCALFMAAHPGLLQKSQYDVIVKEEVWELKHAYRETCLCRTCFNHRCYRESLKVVYKILVLLLKSSVEADSAPDEGDVVVEMDDAEGDDAASLNSTASTTAANVDPRFNGLVEHCRSRSDVASRSSIIELICADSLDDAAANCIRGECDRCGFGVMWSKGYRKEVVDAYGKLRPGVSPLWLQQIRWDRIKTGGDGSSTEDELRQSCEGTILKFMDDYEMVATQHVRHRFHIDQSKRAERDFHRHSIPGLIDCKSDWSENGSLEKKRQLQSEYWVIVYYSLLISISSFLVTSVWRERSSILPIDAEVTVEPPEFEPRSDGTIEAVDGSFWAVVQMKTDEVGRAMQYVEGEDVEYVVQSHDGRNLTVRRYQLRHRKFHRIAFIQITNDKKHDLYSTSAFATRRQLFFQAWHENSRSDAVEWALNDGAERARREAETMAADDLPAAPDARAPDNPTIQAAQQLANSRSRQLQSICLPRPRLPRKFQMSDAQFDEWLEQLDRERFWGWLEDSDNATSHFKSKEMLYYWSQRLEEVDFLRLAWVEFGCPGHGKGPWDGLGAMVKTKVSRDLTNECCLTPSGDIDTALEVAQHVRAIFCTKVLYPAATLHRHIASRSPQCD